MRQITPSMLEHAIAVNVAHAMEEDVGSGDLTAALIPADEMAEGGVITRDAAVICGRPWVDAVFQAVDARIAVDWLVSEGDSVAPDTTLFRLSGPARGLLTGERAALNFLQTLSAIATRSRAYARRVEHTPVKLLDTRKTLPGLRIASKYAVTVGGCHNHRIGLFDAFLIKENHIAACGSISAAVATAKRIGPGRPIEVEVENFAELDEAIAAGADIVMLDDFSLADMQRAVAHVNGRVALEASGGVNEQTLVPIAETGVDYISIGTLTKDCKAVDLSMRLHAQ